MQGEVPGDGRAKVEHRFLTYCNAVKQLLHDRIIDSPAIDINQFSSIATDSTGKQRAEWVRGVEKHLIRHNDPASVRD
ncbi:unnamed protein product [Leuciscus chuanchicus]